MSVPEGLCLEKGFCPEARGGSLSRGGPLSGGGLCPGGLFPGLSPSRPGQTNAIENIGGSKLFQFHAF